MPPAGNSFANKVKPSFEHVVVQRLSRLLTKCHYKFAYYKLLITLQFAPYINNIYLFVHVYGCYLRQQYPWLPSSFGAMDPTGLKFSDGSEFLDSMTNVNDPSDIDQSPQGNLDGALGDVQKAAQAEAEKALGS